MSSVTVEINRVRVRHQLHRVGQGPRLAHEIEAADDFGCREQAVRRGVLCIAQVGAVGSLVGFHGAGSAKFLVRIVDARVHHRDGHAGPVKTGGLHCLRADVRNCFTQIKMVIHHRADRHDIRQGGNSRNAGGIDFHDHRVERFVDPRQLAPPHGFDRAHQFILLPRQTGNVLPLLCGRQAAALLFRIPAVRDRQRRIAQAHHNLHFAPRIHQSGVHRRDPPTGQSQARHIGQRQWLRRGELTGGEEGNEKGRKKKFTHT